MHAPICKLIHEIKSKNLFLIFRNCKDKKETAREDLYFRTLSHLCPGLFVYPSYCNWCFSNQMYADVIWWYLSSDPYQSSICSLMGFARTFSHSNIYAHLHQLEVTPNQPDSMIGYEHPILLALQFLLLCFSIFRSNIEAQLYRIISGSQMHLG